MNKNVKLIVGGAVIVVGLLVAAGVAVFGHDANVAMLIGAIGLMGGLVILES